MTPAEWPLRLVPRRPPPFWKALLISAAAVSSAIAARALFLGVENATGLSVTYFPAFIFATLYAGAAWGWATLVLVLLFGVLTATAMPAGVSREGVIVLYGLSGALSVFVSATLRSALLRLDDARAAGARIQRDLSTSEARSRDSEARFRLLADSAPLLMWISRPDGVREFANQAYVDFLGVSYEEALTFDLRKVLHPEDVDRIGREQVQASKSREMFVQEARYRHLDGGYRWFRSVTQSRISPTGEFIGYVGIGYDITDAKRAEGDLKRINDLLAERVEEALAERDQAEAALRRAQKLEAVGQLTGGVAHDFNNLLTIIIGALDLMQRHPDDAARRERMVEAAQAAARRGERLTQQLLAFSRRQALKPERLNVDALLKESEPLLRRAVGEAVNLSIAVSAPDAVVFVDPSQFEAAVMNLVVNARDATPPGGSIRVETFRCSVAAGQIEDLAAGDYLCVAVHDTGEGMNADVAARVFEPFFTTKETGRGTGLGLSQAYGFARQSGGAIAIESAPGQGATVRIYLPFAQGAVETAAGPAAVQAARRGPALKVLLVEDDLAVGDMVEAMLTDLGHAVVRAERPAEALKILRRKLPFDLMLTDVVMPGGKSGVDLAHEAVELRPGLPIILSSGYTGETLSAAAQAPWPLLLKPYSSEALAETIDTVSQAVAAEA
jgi:PAS domain S-box-containing protein